MQSFKILVNLCKTGLEADADLAAFAQTLQAIEPGTSGFLTVHKGNDYFRQSVPLSLYPFVLITVGNMVETFQVSAGDMIVREMRMHTGMFCNDIDQGTDLAIDFEEQMILSLDRLLGELYIGPDNPDGLIHAHALGAVLTDQDVNRPSIFRMIPVEITYTLG